MVTVAKKISHKEKKAMSKKSVIGGFYFILFILLVRNHNKGLLKRFFSYLNLF